MPKYHYKGVNQLGKAVAGDIEADSLEGANEAVSAKGFFPTKIQPHHKAHEASANLLQRFGRVKPQQLILFTKQLSTMIRTGIPIMRGLDILQRQSESAQLRDATRHMRKEIEDGATLSGALAMHPRIFSRLYCSMVLAGEASGALPQVLDRLIYIVEHEHKVKSEIRAALNYPIIVVFFLVIAFTVLLKFVVPKFANVFARAEIELPLPTRICMNLSEFLNAQWYVVLGSVLALAAVVVLFWRSKRGRFACDFLFLRIPFIGPVLIKASISRFASIFAILQATGVAILDTMKILTGTIGNAVIARDLRKVQTLLEEGHGIAQPLQSSQYFTPMLIDMVAIGEESGTLDEMLNEVSKHYDTEVEYAMQRLADAIGPVLIVLLTFVIGFFALAIYMPMWDLTKMVK